MKIAHETKIKTPIVTNIKETLPPVLKVLFTLAKEKKGGFGWNLTRRYLAAGTAWWCKASERPKVEIIQMTSLFPVQRMYHGVSKAAVAMHRNLVANALQIVSWMRNLETGKETVLMAIPLFHVYGMVAGMLFAIVRRQHGSPQPA
jgi:long-chain acyl-CoA synthetase